jgi:hypothetical protein
MCCTEYFLILFPRKHDESNEINLLVKVRYLEICNMAPTKFRTDSGRSATYSLSVWM